MQSLWWVWFFGIETCLLRASRAILRKFAPSKIPRYKVSVVFSVHWFKPAYCIYTLYIGLLFCLRSFIQKLYRLARQLASYVRYQLAQNLDQEHIRSPISLGQGSCDATALAVLVR